MANTAALTFVLVHSPFVGPYTWSSVAAELRQRGYSALVPPLPPHKLAPYWQHDALAVAHAIAALPLDSRLVLVGHSGGAMLLPAIRQLAARPVAGYIFADAGIPLDGKSRLELLKMELPEVGAAVEQALQQGATFPQWQDEDLRDEIPDAELRAAMMHEFNPQGLDFFSEPIPVFAAWPDAPTAYLQFSAGYDYTASQAQQMGWPYRNINANHFALLTDAARMTSALIDLTAPMGLA